jgi:hypothetical protein
MSWQWSACTTAARVPEDAVGLWQPTPVERADRHRSVVNDACSWRMKLIMGSTARITIRDAPTRNSEK